MNRFVLAICIGFLLLMPGMCSGQSASSGGLDVPVDRSTAVSFFYFGDIWSHWREPMNFYVVSRDDTRLHKVQVGGIASDGWTTWITEDEMQVLIEKLRVLDLDWQHTVTVEHFRPLKQRRIHDWMDVTVISSRGTTKAEIRLTRMCDDLQKIDDAMPTPRILWQFRTLRWDDGCVVPEYHNEERPKQ